MQFRAEFFNLLNRANFNTPNAVVFTPSGSVADGGSDYQHVHHVAADSVRIEAALVGARRQRVLVASHAAAESTAIDKVLVAQATVNDPRPIESGWLEQKMNRREPASSAVGPTGLVRFDSHFAP